MQVNMKKQTILAAVLGCGLCIILFVWFRTLFPHTSSNSKLQQEHELTVLRVDKTLMDNIMEKILSNSVSIVDSTSKYANGEELKECIGKRSLIRNSAAEVWYPYSLANHYHNKKLRYHRKLEKSASTPLFYLVDASPDNALACSPISLLQYWGNVSDSILALESWRTNSGMDFIIPAFSPCNPERSLVGTFDHERYLFAHATFLTADFDCSAKYPKDIVIPYQPDMEAGIVFPTLTKHRKYLLFFASKKIQMARTRILSAYGSMTKQYDDIIIKTLDSPLPKNKYLEYMRESKFCFVVRGDTLSTRDLFTAISTGCIPVIVADWIILPFERFIDYSKFTVSLEEADVFQNADKVLDKLRSISTEQLAVMQQHLSQAKKYLMYDSSDVINPISLMFAEAFMLRYDYCKRRSVAGVSGGLSSMCTQVLLRAMPFVQEIENNMEFVRF